MIKVVNVLNKPWSAHLEMSFGCDNRCPFCYKQVLDKPKGEYDFMSPETTYEISSKMRKAGWDGIMIELDLRGEPFLNPYFFKNIKIMNDNLPNSQILVTTNGNNVTPKKARHFFRNGGNILVMDCYKNDLEERKEIYSDFKLYDYYVDEFNPYANHNNKNLNVIVLMDNLAFRNGEKKTRVILNAGGNVDFNKTKKFGLYPLKEPYNKKCVKPFREIVFLHNGILSLCCEDSNEDCILGDIKFIQDLNDFWLRNKKLNVVRALLYNKIRYNLPCINCDYKGGMRIGLLPKMKNLSEDEVKNYKKYLNKNK